MHKVCDEAQTTLPATTSVAPGTTEASDGVTSETAVTQTSTQVPDSKLAPQTTKSNVVPTNGTVTDALIEATTAVIVIHSIESTTATPATEVSDTTNARLKLLTLKSH